MEIHEEWLAYADEDLQLADLALGGNLLKGAVYHAQQGVEKSLKGYLSFKGQPLQKTHNLRILVQLCLDHDTIFSEILVDTLELNGLDVAFRYPGESSEILELDYAQQIVESAWRIWQFVKNKFE